jgi:hypothetical protein
MDVNHSATCGRSQEGMDSCFGGDLDPCGYAHSFAVCLMCFHNMWLYDTLEAPAKGW